MVLDASGVLHPAGCENSALRSELAGRSSADVRGAMSRIQGAIDESKLLPIVPDFVRSVEAAA